jgi:hypothetical protein
MINILLNIFCMNNDLTQYLDKFKLKGANDNAPFVTICSQNMLGIFLMQTWKNHQKNSYHLQICCNILFSKDVFKGFLFKYVIFSPLKIILRVLKATKKHWKIIGFIAFDYFIYIKLIFLKPHFSII